MAASPTPLPTEPAARLAELQRRIRAVSDFDGTTIPRAARPLLKDLRSTSVALIRRVVADEVSAPSWLAGTNALALEEAISQAAKKAGVDVAPRDTTTKPANARWNPAVTRSRTNPRYLVIGFYYAVPCGNDAGYLVYDRKSPNAEPLITLTSPLDNTIQSMFWNARFTLSPPGSAAPFHFALSRVEPWCQSAQRNMQLLVVTPSSEIDKPHIVVNITVPQHLRKPYRMNLTGTSVSLESHDGISAAKHRWTIRDGTATPLQ